MKVSIDILVLYLFFTAATSSLIVGASSGNKGHASMHDRIKPKLDPKSDQVFFRSDYPDDSDAKDHEPPVFMHPYPAVQDSDNFDADYVKDENNDNGEWKAQMTYDLFRSRVAKRREDAMHKQNTLDEIRRELEEARKRYANAKDAAASSKRDMEASNNELGSAKAKYRRFAAGEGAARASPTSDGSAGVEAAMKEVRREMRHLERCRKQLEEARARLKALLAVPPGGAVAGAPAAAPPPGMAPGVAPPPAPAAAAAKAMGPAAAHAPAPAPSPLASPAFAPAPAKKKTGKKEVDDELSRLEKESATADAAAAENVAKAAEAKREAAKRAREADEEAERHRTHQLEKQEEAKQLKEDERELQKAAARLRRFRQAEDSDGGVYWKDEHDGRKKKDAPEAFEMGNSGLFTDKKGAAAPRGSGFLFTTVFMVAAVVCCF